MELGKKSAVIAASRRLEVAVRQPVYHLPFEHELALRNASSGSGQPNWSVCPLVNGQWAFVVAHVRVHVAGATLKLKKVEIILNK